MSLPPLDLQHSTRRMRIVNADEDDGMHVLELDFSVPKSPVSVSSESSMSSNEKKDENKDARRSGLLQRSQRSLRHLLGKPSYKEMTDSDFSVPSEVASSPKRDMNDIDGMLKRSKGNSIRNLFAKSSASAELDDDEDDDRNENRERRSRPETVTTFVVKDRTKPHKKVGSFDQLLGRETGRGSRSDDKGRRPEVRKARSGDNVERMSNSLRPEGRKTRSGDNLERMKNSLRSEGQKAPSRPEARRSRSGEHLERRSTSVLPERRKNRSGDTLTNSLRSEEHKPPSKPDGRKTRSGDGLERMSNSLRTDGHKAPSGKAEGRKTRSGDNLEKMRNSLRSESQKPTSRRNVFAEQKPTSRRNLLSEGQKPTSRRNVFRSQSFTMRNQRKEGRRDSLKLAEKVMAEFANFED